MSQRGKRKAENLYKKSNYWRNTELSGNSEKRSRSWTESMSIKFIVMFVGFVHTVVRERLLLRLGSQKLSDSNKTSSKCHLERKGSSAAPHNTLWPLQPPSGDFKWYRIQSRPRSEQVRVKSLAQVALWQSLGTTSDFCNHWAISLSSQKASKHYYTSRIL